MASTACIVACVEPTNASVDADATSAETSASWKTPPVCAGGQGVRKEADSARAEGHTAVHASDGREEQAEASGDLGPREETAVGVRRERFFVLGRFRVCRLLLPWRELLARGRRGGGRGDGAVDTLGRSVPEHLELDSRCGRHGGECLKQGGPEASERCRADGRRTQESMQPSGRPGSKEASVSSSPWTAEQLQGVADMRKLAPRSALVVTACVLASLESLVEGVRPVRCGGKSSRGLLLLLPHTVSALLLSRDVRKIEKGQPDRVAPKARSRPSVAGRPKLTLQAGLVSLLSSTTQLSTLAEMASLAAVGAKHVAKG